MSAQGGYDDLSTPGLASEEDDNVEQILLDMVDSGELELVWLEDQGEFGFYMPEPTGEELILPAPGAHAAPRPRRTIGLRRCAVLTVAAFVSPLVVGTAYASVAAGKPMLPSVVPDIDPPQQAQAAPKPVQPPAPAPTMAPLTVKTVPLVPKAAPKPAPKPAQPPRETHHGPSQPRVVTDDRPGKHRRRFQWPTEGDQGNQGDEGTGRHRRERHEGDDGGRDERFSQGMHAPISPKDLLHHLLQRQDDQTDPQVIQVDRPDSGNTTDSGKHHRDTASDVLDITGIGERGLTMSSATPLGTMVVSAA